MKTITVLNIAIGIIVGVVLAVVGVLTYIDEKPRIKATGEYSSWNTPNNLSFNGFESYSKMDIRNAGDAEAKELKLTTPFRGMYTIDNATEPKQFDNDISLDDLNPGEGLIVEIWSQNSGPWIYPDEVYLTHTRGTAYVDFGYRIIGTKGKVFAFLGWSWPIFAILIPFILLLTIAHINELKKAGKQQESES